MLKIISGLAIGAVFALLSNTARAECAPGLYPIVPGSSLCDVWKKTYRGNEDEPKSAAASTKPETSPPRSSYPEITYSTPASLREIAQSLALHAADAPMTECYNNQEVAQYSCELIDGRRITVAAAKSTTSKADVEKFCDGESLENVTPTTSISTPVGQSVDFVIVHCTEPVDPDRLQQAKLRIPKSVAPADLAVQSNKWKEKWVEVELSCFYADEEDIRCVGGRMRVDFSKLEPASGLRHIQDNCSTIAESELPQCRITTRFRYMGWSSMSLGLTQITLVKAEDRSGYVVASSPARAKRKR